MANEKTPVVWDDETKKHRPLGQGEKMGGLDASSVLSSDAGNLIQTGSDGLALVTGSSLADPRADNLLETSGNGKLQVTVDRIAEWLDGHPQDAALIADAINVVSGDSGNVITAGSDKGAFLSKGAIAAAVAGMTDAQKNQLADAIAARIASDIADGQTIVAANGKLTSNPTNATAAQKKAINQALADADSGLVVDPSTGRLTIDFSQMPTDKFEELLKGLKMQIPLESGLTFFVAVNDANAADALVDGRGTEALPFKTVRACVNYVTQTYALGSYNILIKVKSGTYAESVLLPYFTGTSGSIYIDAYDINNPPVFVNATPNQAYIFSITGGNWFLRNITANAIYTAVSGDIYPRTVRICEVTENGVLTIIGGSYSSSYTGAAHTQSFVMHGLNANTGGTIKISFAENSKLRLECYKGNATTANMFRVARGGSINFFSGNFAPTALSEYEIEYRGESSSFLSASFNATVTTVTGGLHNPTVVVPSGGSAIGKPYTIDGGSGVYAPHGGFPGDDTPSLDASTYSWYKEV